MNQADVRRQIGDALRADLAAAGVSQSALARGIDRPPGTVSAWVNGTNLPSVGDVAAIDEFLGCRLLDDAGITTRPTLLDALAADDALDDQAEADMRERYEQAIAETARRRIAEVTRDGDTTGSTPVTIVDPRGTSPAAVLLLLQLFGRDEIRRLADELATAAS